MKLKRLFLYICVCAAIAAVTASAPAAFAEETERVKISVAVTDCSKGEEDGSIRVTIDNFREGGAYCISVNGGKTFHKTEKSSLTLKGAKPGFYRVCAKKGSDSGTLSDVLTVCVGDGDEYGVKIHVIKTDETIYRDGRLKIVIDNYDSSKKYIALISGLKPKEMTKSSMTIGSLGGGEYSVRVVEGKNFSAEFTMKTGSAKAGKKGYIKVDSLLQNPELPTGCEITSLTMLLLHMGYDAEKTVLAGKYLESGEYRASDPRKVFVGNPGEYFSYGCYPPVIKNTAEKFLDDQPDGSDWRVRDISGCKPKNLYAAIDNGYPVMVWVTAGMKEPSAGAEWIIKDTGEPYVWISGEHCVLLTGYDMEKDVVYFNDPLAGKVYCDRALFEKRFAQMGSGAVIITER